IQYNNWENTKTHQLQIKVQNQRELKNEIPNFNSIFLVPKRYNLVISVIRNLIQRYETPRLRISHLSFGI
ncbi:hypothetical protein, partial [Klebsiella variicola]|uniref:hypothetical protein n=1 Tax=Klebsiella variicola TaxID=244366 RepID=UPI0039C21BC8